MRWTSTEPRPPRARPSRWVFALALLSACGPESPPPEEGSCHPIPSVERRSYAVEVSPRSVDWFPHEGVSAELTDDALIFHYTDEDGVEFRVRYRIRAELPERG